MLRVHLPLVADLLALALVRAEDVVDVHLYGADGVQDGGDAVVLDDVHVRDRRRVREPEVVDLLGPARERAEGVPHGVDCEGAHSRDRHLEAERVIDRDHLPQPFREEGRASDPLGHRIYIDGHAVDEGHPNI